MCFSMWCKQIQSNPPMFYRSSRVQLQNYAFADDYDDSLSSNDCFLFFVAFVDDAVLFRFCAFHRT